MKDLEYFKKELGNYRLIYSNASDTVTIAQVDRYKVRGKIRGGRDYFSEGYYFTFSGPFPYLAQLYQQHLIHKFFMHSFKHVFKTNNVLGLSQTPKLPDDFSTILSFKVFIPLDQTVMLINNDDTML